VVKEHYGNLNVDKLIEFMSVFFPITPERYKEIWANLEKKRSAEAS